MLRTKYFILIVHNSMVKVLSGSRGSTVNILSDYGLDDRGLIPDRDRGFSYSLCVRPALRPTQPPVQWVPGVADLPPPSSAEVKNE
jgi:hypothetical protein